MQNCGGESQWNLNRARFAEKVLQTAIVLQNTNLQIRTVLISTTLSHTMMSFVTRTLADVDRQLENVMIRLNLRQKHGTGEYKMNEEWKVIEGYDFAYRVSNFGRVEGTRGLMKRTIMDMVILL